MSLPALSALTLELAHAPLAPVADGDGDVWAGRGGAGLAGAPLVLDGVRRGRAGHPGSGQRGHAGAAVEL